MSRTNAVYFNSCKSLEETAAIIAQHLHLKFTPEQDEGNKLYVCVTLGIEIVLCREHGMEDDRELEYSRYEYELLFRNWYKHHRGVEELREAAAQFAYDIISNRLGYPAMSIFDSQKLIERNEILTCATR